MITTVNLEKRYGHLVAIKNLNLHIEQGEFFGFLGPNGAGKTTTIKILVGLLKPSAGSATIAGYDIQRAPQEAKRQIGLSRTGRFSMRSSVAANFSVSWPICMAWKSARR